MEQIGHELMQTISRMRPPKLKGVDAFGIRHAEVMLVVNLKKYLMCSGDEKIKTTKLSEMLELSPSTITPMLNSLEDKGYVERVYDKQDRRVVYVKFTGKGNELAEALHSNFKKQMSELTEYLGIEDVKELHRILNKIADYYSSSNNVEKIEEDQKQC